jgi:hypothetical protein
MTLIEQAGMSGHQSNAIRIRRDLEMGEAHL